MFELDHIHLRSVDPASASQFYQHCFNAKVVSRTENRDGLRVIVQIAGVRLFIDKAPAATASPPSAPHLGLEHIGLRVEDLDEVVNKLRDKGASFTAGITAIRPGVRIAFVEAPDNVCIELLERSPE